MIAGRLPQKPGVRVLQPSPAAGHTASRVVRTGSRWSRRWCRSPRRCCTHWSVQWADHARDVRTRPRRQIEAPPALTGTLVPRPTSARARRVIEEDAVR